MKTCFLSGAGGFIGHHCLEHFLTATDWNVVATDSFRHHGTTDRIVQVLDPHPGWGSRLKVITHDLAAPFTPATIKDMGSIDYMIAMASESHVDRSITDPVPFVRNNVEVMLTTLELARELRPRAVIVISTDEIYGPVRGIDEHPEWDAVIPSNPYSASKAAQEAIAISYWRTYGVPVVIVNIMNMIGERQSGEKMLPMLIRKISRGEEVPLHGTRDNIGSRHYLHARNLADALVFLLQRPPAMFPDAGRPDRWNVAGLERVSNLELAERVATIVGSSLWYKLIDFHTARPGHDPHYGLDGTKLAEAGWKPPVPFAESLERTVRWSMLHPEWLE